VTVLIRVLDHPHGIPLVGNEYLPHKPTPIYTMTQDIISSTVNVSSEKSSWLRGIEFYQDEINIMRKRLSEVSNANTNQDLKKKIEQFQNQFEVHEEQLKKLKHAVNSHAIHISNDFENHHGQLERSTLTEHDTMRDDYVNTEKLFNQMRHDFNRFLSKYL
jgi:seryl-tRNA synthetase